MSIDRSRRAFFTRLTASTQSEDVGLPWLTSRAEFIDKCSQCGHCLEACPEKIITKGEGGFPTVNFSLGECTYCQSCTTDCPESLFDTTQPSPWELSLTINDQCFTKRHVVCQSCKDACDAQAITFDFRAKRIPEPQVNIDACTQCGACASICPANAISLTNAHRKTDTSEKEESYVE